MLGRTVTYLDTHAYHKQISKARGTDCTTLVSMSWGGDWVGYQQKKMEIFCLPDETRTAKLCNELRGDFLKGKILQNYGTKCS